LQHRGTVPACGKAIDVAHYPRKRLFVGYDRCEDTPYPGEPDDPGDSTGVIRVVVRKDERIQPAYPLARQGRSQRVRVRTGVYQHRVATVPDEDGVTLTHVEHNERCIPGVRESCCRNDEKDRAESYQRSCTPPA